MPSEKPKVGCIGAGVLGGAIMRRLIQCGYAPAVWNRDPGKLQALVAAGAVAAESPEQLARASTFVITCISDGAAVENERLLLVTALEDAEIVLVDVT